MFGDLISYEKLCVCMNQLISADIHGLFLNPTFGVSLILALPMCLALFVLVSEPPKNLSVEELVRFLRHLHNYADTFSASFLKPFTWSPFAFPCVLLGWFHQLVAPKIGIMVQGTWLTPPFTYRRVRPFDVEGGFFADSVKQILHAHDPMVNHMWVCFEHTKCMVLQYLDWLVIHYMLVCCLCVLWCMSLRLVYVLLGVGLRLLLRVIPGPWYTVVVAPRLQRGVLNLCCGPISSVLFNKDYNTMEQYFIRMRYSWKSAHVAVLMQLETIFFSPFFWLIFWLPLASMEYSAEIYSIQKSICFHAFYGYETESLGSILANPSSRRPLLFWAHNHMQCVHGVWKALGLMEA